MKLNDRLWTITFCHVLLFLERYSEITPVKLFAPSLRCLKCNHANSFDFPFYQQCGYNRKIIHCRSSTTLDVDVNDIDRRLQQLAFGWPGNCLFQKSLQKELENSISSLLRCPTFPTVTPRDICRFWVLEDKNGKTQVHRNGCPHLGKRGTYDCACLLRLSFKTVDSYIGKKRAIFHAIGRERNVLFWLVIRHSLRQSFPMMTDPEICARWKCQKVWGSQMTMDFSLIMFGVKPWEMVIAMLWGLNATRERGFALFRE